MTYRVRLLPIVIFTATLTLTLRVGALWHDADTSVVSSPRALAAADKAEKKEAAADDKKAAGKEPAARDGAADAKAAGKAVASKNPEKDNSGVGDQFDPSSVTQAEFQVLQRLAKRRAELDKQREGLDLRENLLKATERRLDAKIAELNKIKATIEGLLKKHDKEQEDKLKSLVQIYEKMKPKSAARIFEQLEMDILLSVIERMREAKTAPIFAAMDPAKAKAVTSELALRRQLPEMKAKSKDG